MGWVDGGETDFGTLVLLMSELCLRNFKGQTSIGGNDVLSYYPRHSGHVISIWTPFTATSTSSHYAWVSTQRVAKQF